VVVGCVELLVVEHEMLVGVVLQKIFDHRDAVVSLEVVELEELPVIVWDMSFVDKHSKADSPLGDRVLEAELKNLLPLLVPNLK